MSDSMRRLLDDRADPRITSVLRAGLDDDPSRESMKRAARALGIGSAIALSAASSASVAAKGGGGGMSAVFAAIAKWFTIGALMGGVTTSPWIVRSITTSPATMIAAPTAKETEAVPARPPVVSPPPSPAMTATTEEQRAEPVSRKALPSAALGVVTKAPEPSPTAPPSSTTASVILPERTLDAEVGRLDEARRLLKAGNPSGALGALDRYQSLRAPHTLAAEASLLRVQALVASGNKAEAERIARAVLAQRGTDGYACRLARLATISGVGCPE